MLDLETNININAIDNLINNDLLLNIYVFTDDGLKKVQGWLNSH